MPDSAPFQTVIRKNFALAKGIPIFEYEASFKAGGYQFKALNVAAVTVRHDYIDKTFPLTQITVALDPKTYQVAVKNGFKNLVVTLHRRVSGSRKAATVQHYRALTPTLQDEVVAGNSRGASDFDRLAQGQVNVISFDLLDFATYDLRMRSVGATFRDTQTKDVLAYLLAKLDLKTEYSESKAVGTINIEKELAEIRPAHVVIPDGTAISDLARKLQAEFGVGNAGLGCFLSRLNWYVYQPFNTKQFTKPGPRLVVINVPASLARGMDKTYHMEGSTLTVMSTGATRHSDSSEQDYLNEGTGVIFSDPSKLINGMVDTTPSKTPQTTPKDTVTEYRVESHQSGFNLTRSVPGRFSSNPAAVSSSMASRGGQRLEITWENGDIDLIKPCMPVRFLYDRNGKVEKLEGRVHRVVSHSSIANGGLVERRHGVVLKLSLFLK